MNGKSEKKYAQAIYDFKASHADELSLKAGDVIQVGWWFLLTIEIKNSYHKTHFCCSKFNVNVSFP